MRWIDGYVRHLADLKRREVPPSRPLKVLAAHVAALRETIAEEASGSRGPLANG
jgi:hypothetical protein